MPIIVFILLASIIILAYCPTIFRELNDLECLAVRTQEKAIAKALATSADPYLEKNNSAEAT